MPTEGYYERLGLTKDAEQSQIKDAYRKLAFKYHPDRNPGNDEAAETMKYVNEAYAVLSNPEKRAEYDRMRSMFGDRAHDRFRQSYSADDIFRGSDINDIFETLSKMFTQQGFSGQNGNTRTFYWQFGGSNQTNANANGDDFKVNNVFLRYLMGKFMPMQGDDVNDVIWVNGDLAYSGGPYAYENVWQGKKLVVQVPKGVKDGQTIKLGGMGKPGKNGGQAGDLLIKVRVRKSGAAVLEELKDTAKSKFRKLFKK